MKELAIALIGTLVMTSNDAFAENLPADTVPVLTGATVRSIREKPCIVSLREWTQGSEKDTVAFYSNWAVSKGLTKSDKPASSNADWRIWYFGNPQTHASLTLILSSEKDHNFVGITYDVGNAKQGCPDSPMIR